MLTKHRPTRKRDVETACDGMARAAGLRPGHAKGRQAAPSPCRSRSRTSRPSRNASSSSFPGRTWSPSSRRPMTRSVEACGCRASARARCPRALIEKMYKRQVEDEVARDLVEHSIGQAIRENQIQPVAPPTVEDAGDQVGRAVQVHGARRGAVAGHAQGLHRAAAVAPAGQGDRRAGRGGAGGLPAAADRVQAGRGPHRRPATPTWCWSSCPAGSATTSSRSAQVAIDLENDAEGPLPGPAQPPARQADRRRAGRGRLHAARRGRCCPSWPASRCTCT